MSGYSKTVATIILLGLVSLLGIDAQAQETVSGSQRKTVVFLDSTKEQEGLSGAVRRMRVESAKLELKSGKLTEGPRQLLEVTAYDVNGKRIENVSYPFAASSTGKEEYKYDSSGNVVEMTLRRDDGSILSKERYEYEYDNVGNWTKMMTSLVVFEDGELKLEPVEVTYRSFSYYFNETVEKMINAKSPKTSQLAASPNSVTAIEPAKDRNRVESNPENPSPMVMVTAADKTIASNFSAKTPEVSSPETTPALDGTTAKPINNAAGFTEASHTPVLAKPAEESVINTTTNQVVDTKRVDVPLSNAAVAEKTPDLKTGTLSQAEEGDKGFLGKSSKFGDRSPAESTSHASSESIGVPNSSTVESAKSVLTEASPSPVHVVKISEEQPTRLPAAAAYKATEASTSEVAVTSADSQNAKALYALGRDRFDSKDFKGAIEAYKQSIKLEPESAEYQVSLAHAYMQLKKNGDAINALKQAIRLNPEALEAHYGLGLLYFTTRRYTDAVAAFKQAIKLDPKMSKAHYGLAMTHSELRNNEELLREYRILQKLDPALARKLSETFPDFNLLPCRVPPFCK